jgi:hypothetical protein
LKIFPRSQERVINAIARLYTEAYNIQTKEKTIRTENTVAACQSSSNKVITVSAVDVPFD